MVLQTHAIFYLAMSGIYLLVVTFYLGIQLRFGTLFLGCCGGFPGLKFGINNQAFYVLFSVALTDNCSIKIVLKLNLYNFYPQMAFFCIIFIKCFILNNRSYYKISAMYDLSV